MLKGKLVCLFTFMVIVICSEALLGCATLGKDECLQADWYTIGYEDGARGYRTSRIGQHREACARHGVKPDFQKYERGHTEGLREYCTPQKGYALGSSGKSYNHVCPESLEAGFFKGYQKGRTIYAAKREVREAQDLLKRIYEDIDAIEQQLDAYENELVRNGTSPKRRRYLLEEIKILTDEHDSLVDQAADQEMILEDAEKKHSELQQKSFY